MAAEFAIAMPATLAVLALCIGGVHAGALQLRLEDAAADAARGIARGDEPGVVTARAERAVPGSGVEWGAEGELVCATLRASVRLGGVGTGIELAARSCALAGGR